MLSKNNIERVIHQNNDEYYMLEHTFRSDVMQSAYEPIMEWIRQIYIANYKDMISEVEFLKQCGVYQNQMEVFTTYLRAGHCVRKEDVIMCEVAYEKEKFIISLVSIIQYIAREKTLFLILNGFSQKMTTFAG